MRRRKLRTALCVMLVGTVLTAFVAIAAEAGSQGDPLVTLSYLNDTFLGQLLGKVDSKIEEQNQTIRQELEQRIDQAEQDILGQMTGIGTVTGMSSSYHEVTLSDGQTLYGSAGCEVMLRSGSASCVSEGKSTPGLVDISGGSTINHGSAQKENHRYNKTADRGVQAAGSGPLLVRGSYTIG